MRAARSAKGERFVHESVLGTEFIGSVLGTARVGDVPAIRPSITGNGWITAFHQYVLDPSDPFPNGFRVGDTWPTGPRDPLSKRDDLPGRPCERLRLVVWPDQFLS